MSGSGTPVHSKHSLTVVPIAFSTVQAGDVGRPVTTYRIEWAWLGLPLIVVLASFGYLALSILKSKTSSAPFWKSSSLAIISRGQYVRSALDDAVTLSSMERAAKSYSADLFATEREGMCVPVEIASDREADSSSLQARLVVCTKELRTKRCITRVSRPLVNRGVVRLLTRDGKKRKEMNTQTLVVTMLSFWVKGCCEEPELAVVHKGCRNSFESPLGVSVEGLTLYLIFVWKNVKHQSRMEGE